MAMSWVAIPEQSYIERVGAALASNLDLWGEEVMARPEGPTFENMQGYLLPQRYVDTPFKYYPIVLSLKDGREKVRLVSNGSEIGLSINPRRRQGSWDPADVRVLFLLGQDEEPFGQDLERLRGPSYLNGYLPIVQTSYIKEGVRYDQEVFATALPGQGEKLCVYAHLSALPLGDAPKSTRVTIRLNVEQGTLFQRDDIIAYGRESYRRQGICCQFSAGGVFDPPINKLSYSLDLSDGQLHDIFLMLPNESARIKVKLLDAARYTAARDGTVAYWNGILATGTEIEVPEPVVNNAWRALVIGTFMLVNGDEMRYSFGNGYDRPWMAECGDAIMALAMLGYADDARRYLKWYFPYKDYIQTIYYHDNAYKLQFASQYYFLFRDRQFIEDNLSVWIDACEFLLDARQGTGTGLLPKENHCGDIMVPVNTLNTNASSWRGLRDIALVLQEIGLAEEAQRYLQEAADFRRAIVAAVDRHTVRDFDPPFVPYVLSGEEKPYEKLTATTWGSYYCLMMPYVLGSDVFGIHDQRTGYILDYLHKRGGILLGLIRFQYDRNAERYVYGYGGIDDLYGMRYNWALLQRDEIDRFLVAFYGKLTAGFTPDTFISGEGASVEPIPGERGRRMVLPPLSASNAAWLQSLRHMLVMERDTRGEGLPDELVLMNGTPRGWLEDGKRVRVSGAPTYFGVVGYEVTSHLGEGFVEANLELPERNAAERTLLKLRVPGKRRMRSVVVNGVSHSGFDAGKEVIDLSGLTGKTTVRVSY
ncbi:MAG: hypothetical protein ACUVWR_11490 [Anaerolineae bacterium]